MRIIDADTDEALDLDPFDLIFGKEEGEKPSTKSMTMMEKVKKRAEQTPYSVTEIAEAIGFQDQALVNRLTGKNIQRTVDMLHLMCLALDVPLKYFCSDDIDDEEIMTLLSLKAARTLREEKERFEQKQKALRQKYKEAVIKNKQGRKA